MSINLITVFFPQNFKCGYSASYLFSRLSLLLLILVAPAVSITAQNIQNPQSAVDNLMRSNLQVDPATGALQLQIPLGGPAGRGEADVPVMLRYSSKIWNIKFHALLPCSGEPVTEYQAEYAKTSRAGWTTSVGGAGGSPDVSVEIYDPLTQKPATRGNTIARKYVTLLDGSRHELRRDDAVHSPGEDLSGNYYAVDGSRIWMDAAGTIFMPDGSRYQNVNGQLQHIDRNGNFIALVGGVWQDTLNRSIPIPIPSNSPPPGAAPYTLPGGMTYTLIWKNLADVLTTSQPLLNQGDANPGCVPGAGGDSLFHSMDGQQKVLKIGIHNPVVLSQIVLPNNTNYTFTYNVWGEIDQIVYPTGGSEQFKYGIWPALGGQLDDGTYSQANHGIITRTVSDGVTPPQTWNYDPAPLGITGVDPASVPRSVIAPDGSKTVTWYYKSRGFDIKYGFDDARAGMPREERVYNSSNTMLRRTLLQAVADGPQPGGFNTATRNARVTKKVDIILATDDNALAAATEFTYDSDLNVIKTNYYDYVSISKSIAENGDIPSILSGPLTLLRSDETDYLTSDQNYRTRNLLSLPTATRVKDGLGNLVAQSSIGYDDAALLPEIPSTNWSNPGTNARGNPTTISRWVNLSGNQFTTWPAGSYVVTHAEYDQAGNLRKSTDAKGNQSQIEYSSAFANAYPTLTRSAVPDPSGEHGSLTSLESTTDYDFNTGLIKSKRDANGQTTAIDYTDPLNRVKQVTQPNGAHVTYNYFDSSNDLHVSISTDLDTSRVTETRKYFDRLGRPTRAFVYDGTASTPWVVTDNYYDIMGRVSKISNPYRVSTPDSAVPVICAACTTTIYDGLGRVRSEITPDNAQVTTSYGVVTSGLPLGATTTVSDQSLRKRRSLTDSLGRLVRVDEPDPQTGDLDVGGTSTTYAYDVLGNLRKVTQGGQQRFFLYDSLSRLLRSHNPEQLAGSLASNLTDPITDHAQWSQAYGYDNNGNLTTRVDARNITTTYGYDALNRSTSVTYSDGVTPSVNRYYDSATNGKGRLYWDEAVGVSANVFDVYDALGRPTQYHQKFWANGAWGQDFKITRTYDQAGHVLTQTYPSGHIVNYTYDSAGRVVSSGGNIGDGVSRTYSSAATYSVFGGLQEEQFGTQTSLYHKLHYNVRGQLYDVRLSTYSMQTNELDWNRGAVVNYFSGNYTFGASGTDNNGNVLRQASFIPANDSLMIYNYTEDTFSYDFLNRLKSVSERPATQGGYGSPAITQMFDYDVYGNRTINQAGTTQLSGVSNRLATSISTTTNRLYALGETDQSHFLIDYDAAGNQKKDYYSDSASGYSYDRTYDADNRMIGSTVTYSIGGSQLFNYFYDADGQRIKRKTGTTETWQIYGLDGELLAEYQAAAAPYLPVTEYGYRGGALLTTISSGDPGRLQRFVYNLYYGAKQRDPSAQELQDATNQLAAAGVQGQTQLQQKAAEIARSLFVQTNYEAPKTDVQFVTDLYYAYLHRAPDDSGLSWWSTNHDVPGAPIIRVNVLNAFEASGEFQTLVSTLFGSATSDNERTEHFVNDFYLGAYGRNATSTELQQQRDSLNTEAAKGQNNVQTQAETMGRALFAPQINDSSISNNQYVTNLYEAFLQRGPDTGGLSFWSPQANVGQGRLNVLNAFATCPPFRELAGTLYREANWLVTDHLGTPRIIVNKSGALNGVKRHDYLPFGEELGANIGGRTTTQGYSGDNIRQKFTSKERDTEIALDYFNARYYGSSLGRFTSPDPTLLSVNGFNPQTWNRFTYVLNNPLAYVDPLGLWALQSVMIYKTDKNGDFERDRRGRLRVDHIEVIAVRTSDKDTAASLAKQLGLTGKAAETFAQKVGGGNDVRLSQQGGDVGRVFGAVEQGLKEQHQFEIDHPERRNQGPNSADCSETACRIAFPQQMFGTLTFSVQEADATISAEGATSSVQESNLSLADIVRWADARNKPTHFASFIFRNDDGVPVVFSKSGERGRYETATTSEIGIMYPTYGTIRGINSGQTGYYHPR